MDMAASQNFESNSMNLLWMQSWNMKLSATVCPILKIKYAVVALNQLSDGFNSFLFSGISFVFPLLNSENIIWQMWDFVVIEQDTLKTQLFTIDFYQCNFYK